ncbi:MAG: signal peptidase II [Candidatus Aureabacteria bacterium]|nr:signal peptidase II [Candidatus Auribacterota bacterium]
MRRADGRRATGIAAPAIIAVAVAALDQASKLLILLRLRPGRLIPSIAGFFNLTLIYNQGTAFGLFHRHGIVFIFLSLATIAALAFFYRRLLALGANARWSAGLILGGAAGNLVDRVFRGAVVDFLDFYLTWGGEEYHWPAFNIADSAICAGVGLLLVTVVFQKQKQEA